MKINALKSLAILFVAITMLATEASAVESLRRPNRRRTKTQESNVVTTADTLHTATIEEATQFEATVEECYTEAATRRENTPQQLDSILAIWRHTSTVEYYERYFNDFCCGNDGSKEVLATSISDSVYISRLQALMSPVPLKYNHEVRRAIERFSSKSYASIMSYAYHYFPMIEEELDRAGLPHELRALVVVESGLNPLATSRAGAKGLWQFMLTTGKEYGLEINSLVDERCNPRLATRAACRYLKTMYDIYGDWTLAIASYNCGPGNVNKAITRSGGNRENFTGDFWDVYYHLPSETRGYVPLFMGATYAFAYHKAHGIEFDPAPLPLIVDTIMINRPMHLEQVSSTIDIDIETLKMLNPQYTLSIIPATTKSYPLTLPVERISDYIENEKAIHAKDSTFLKEYVIHANIEKKRTEAPPAKYHTVKKGETLGAIARKYGRTVKQLMTWNGIKNANSLRIGQRLRVSAN
ncbi:MAG: transglycosylase SLT domain-containing protein [Alistipes sp.]|nr:transglycosylase SLT domain-containing protein [Alistipes sp.]